MELGQPAGLGAAAAPDAGDVAQRASDAAVDRASPSDDIRDAFAATDIQGNRAPMVSVNQNIRVRTSTGSASLMGVATDDGLPLPRQLTYSWMKTSGPGAIAFAEGSAAVTTARFSMTGTYVVRLTVSDGALSAFAETTVTVLGLDLEVAAIWSFDDAAGVTARDGSGGENHVTLMGGAIWATGRFGSALDLSSATTDYASLPASAGAKLDFGANDFTISVWIKNSALPQRDNRPSIVSKVDRATQEGYSIFLLTAVSGMAPHVYFKLTGSASVGQTYSMATIADGAWHNIVARRTATLMELFIDGKLDGFQSHAVGSLSTAAAPLEIGGHPNFPASDFAGQIDDLRLYRRAVTDAEVAALANP